MPGFAHKGWKKLEVEPFVQEGTGMLSLAGECSFCAHTCQRRQCILFKKIEHINGRTRYYKSELGRMLALLKTFSTKGSLSSYPGGWDCGCD